MRKSSWNFVERRGGSRRLGWERGVKCGEKDTREGISLPPERSLGRGLGPSPEKQELIKR